MKSVTKLFVVITAIFFSCNIVDAQNTRKEKQAAKGAAIKRLIDGGNYVFTANTANPQRGGSRQLTSADYDLTVSKDTIKAYLPYFGRAYVAPVDPTEGGIKFTCTNFDYTIKQNAKGNWDVLIKPKDKHITDMRDVQQMRLNISTGGYASLQVISTNRDPISFDGYIEEKGKNN